MGRVSCRVVKQVANPFDATLREPSAKRPLEVKPLGVKAISVSISEQTAVLLVKGNGKVVAVCNGDSASFHSMRF